MNSRTCVCGFRASMYMNSRTYVCEHKDPCMRLKELHGHLQGPFVSELKDLCAGCSRTSEYELKDLCVRLKDLCVWLLVGISVYMNSRTYVCEDKDPCVWLKELCIRAEGTLRASPGSLCQNSKTSVCRFLKDMNSRTSV